MLKRLLELLHLRRKEPFVFVVGSPEGNYIVDTSTELWTCEPLTDLFQPISDCRHTSDK